MDKEFNGSAIKAISLFTGAGGLDIGFHNLGANIVACSDIDPVFCETLELNRGRYLPKDCKIVNADIRDLEPQELSNDPIDLIIGGPPCQSFSAAGRRAGGVTGISDERGSLYEQYCRFVNHFQPKAFLFENVRGIISANKGNDWREILQAFRELGYRLYFKVLDAADYGVPQYRERLILIGINGYIGEPIMFPRPTHGVDSISGTPHVTPRVAISSLQEDDEPEQDYGGKYGDLLREVPPGMNYLFFTEEMGHANPVFAWRSRFSDFLYKADPDKPVKTIVAKLGRYSGPFHWKSRRFTVEEFKRLQSFPDDYLIAGSLNQQLMQIGNSVAPRFGQALASSLLTQVFGKDSLGELIPQEFPLSFDKRKKEKARQTRTKRIQQQKRRASSVDVADNITNEFDQRTHLVQHYQYDSLRKRFLIHDTNDLSQKAYRFDFWRKNSTLSINVTKIHANSPASLFPLELDLRFKRKIGDGVKRINCQLRSNVSEDITIAWDAIELGLRSASNYNSLIDIFGHFTEPHPIFELNITPYDELDDKIVRFARYFSDFSHNAELFPAEALKEIMGLKENIRFLPEVKKLREMRFDIRVNETNPTIPLGMFRCCYPFPLGYGKQTSVKWSEHTTSNSELVI